MWFSSAGNTGGEDINMCLCSNAHVCVCERLALETYPALFYAGNLLK